MAGALMSAISLLSRPIGKQYMQTIESKHIDLRTRIKQLVRRTIVFSKSQLCPIC
jgi:IS1 family transposase